MEGNAIPLELVKGGTTVDWLRVEEGRWTMTPSGKSNPILASIIGAIVRIHVGESNSVEFVTIRSFVPQGFARSRRLLQSLSDNTSRKRVVFLS